MALQERGTAQSWAGPRFEKACVLKPGEAEGKERIWGLTWAGYQGEVSERWEQEEGAGETGDPERLRDSGELGATQGEEVRCGWVPMSSRFRWED